MNVYDFDGTIYRGDSSVDFWIFCMKRHPGIILDLPGQIFAAIKCKLGAIDKLRFKERYFSFLRRLKDPRAEVSLFWDAKQKRIKEWYLNRKQEDDLIISASPEFLLNEICRRTGIRHLIASDVDIASGTFASPNCYGSEKLRRFKEAFPETSIEEFYSDSRSDQCLAEIAEKAFIVKGDKVREWG